MHKTNLQFQCNVYNEQAGTNLPKCYEQVIRISISRKHAARIPEVFFDFLAFQGVGLFIPLPKVKFALSIDTFDNEMNNILQRQVNLNHQKNNATV